MVYLREAIKKRKRKKKLKKRKGSKVPRGGLNQRPKSRLQSVYQVVTTNYGGGEGGSKLCIIFTSDGTSTGASETEYLHFCFDLFLTRIAIQS